MKKVLNRFGYIYPHAILAFFSTIILVQTASAIIGPGAAWTKVRKITLSTPATTPSADFQVKVTLTTATFGANYTNIKADGSDLRFYDANDNPCSYYIDAWVDGAASNTVWVKVPIAGTGVLYMFYGNAAATAASNGDNTFIFFDDFLGSSLDGNKWGSFQTTTHGEAITVAGGNLTLSCGTNSNPPVAFGAQVIGKTSFNVSDGVIMEEALGATVTNRCGARGSMGGATSLPPTSTSLGRFDLDPTYRWAAHEIGQGGVFGFPGRQSNIGAVTSVYNFQPAGNSAGGTIASGTTLAIHFTSSNIFYYRGGILQGTSNATAPTGTVFPLLSSIVVPNCMGGTNNSVVIAYIRLRKFSATGDPATTFGTEGNNNLNAVINTHTNVNCFGQSTGSATVTATGATTPYLYLWSNGQTVPTATGLAASLYSVTVTDNIGLTAIAQVTITQPAASVVATVTDQSNISCFAANDGSITIQAQGGTGTYQFSVNNGASWHPPTSGATISIFGGLLPNTPYRIRVKDSNECISR